MSKETRTALAKLPFSEKLRMLEKLRKRDLAIKAARTQNPRFKSHK